MAASASPKTGTLVSSRRAGTPGIAETRDQNAVSASAKSCPNLKHTEGCNGVARPRRHHRSPAFRRRAFEAERVARVLTQRRQHRLRHGCGRVRIDRQDLHFHTCFDPARTLQANLGLCNIIRNIAQSFTRRIPRPFAAQGVLMSLTLQPEQSGACCDRELDRDQPRILRPLHLRDGRRVGISDPVLLAK